jgi:hypothetical protein
MAFECRVERHSVAYGNKMAATFVIRFPRVVLAETVTHRLNSDTWGEWEVICTERTTTPEISKNSASSRAIPFPKMLETVSTDPYMPFWTMQQKGMQGKLAEVDRKELFDYWWLKARDFATEIAQQLHDEGCHKQDSNRLLEPWGWITQVVTASQWDNFFALRCHHAAHPAFRYIARRMYLALRKSKPQLLESGQWHLPFLPLEEQMNFTWLPSIDDPYAELPYPIKASAARCAWVSYENHDRESTPEAHLRTFDRLLSEIPVHASPVEHQLSPMPVIWNVSEFQSNVRGWLQARKLVKHERIEKYEPPQSEIDTWDMKEYE